MTVDPASVIQKSTEVTVTNTGQLTRTTIYYCSSNDPYEDPVDIFKVVNGGRDVFGTTWKWGTKEDTGVWLSSAVIRLRNVEENRFEWVCIFTHKDYRNQQEGNNRPNKKLQRKDPPQQPGAAVLAAIDEEDIRWGGSFFPAEKLEQFAEEGIAVINSADQPFDAQAIPRQWPTIIVEFPTTSLDVVARASWLNRVNQTEFWGFNARELLMAKWDYNLLYAADASPYIMQRVEIWCNSKTWDTELPNYGTVTKIPNPSGSTPKDLYDPILFKGDIPGTNLMLEPFGTVAADQTKVNTKKYLHFEQLDFSTIPSLPSALPEALGGPAPTPPP